SSSASSPERADPPWTAATTSDGERATRASVRRFIREPPAAAYAPRATAVTRGLGSASASRARLCRACGVTGVLVRASRLRRGPGHDERARAVCADRAVVEVRAEDRRERRRTEHLLRRALGDLAPLLQHDAAPREAAREVELVGRDQRRAP